MLLIAGLPAALILLQPDLGTMLVLSATVFGVVGISGAPRRWLVGLFAGGVLAAAVALAPPDLDSRVTAGIGGVSPPNSGHLSW